MCTMKYLSTLRDEHNQIWDNHPILFAKGHIGDLYPPSTCTLAVRWEHLRIFVRVTIRFQLCLLQQSHLPQQ